MGQLSKTDNTNVGAKLHLRRWFLRHYHRDNPPHVLDACQGDMVLWRTLRAEFAVRSYWGVDLKPKRGRVQVDSARILEQPGWRFNVIDIDVYGSPWKHWFALLPNIRRPTTVFMTIGQVMCGSDVLILEALGLKAIRRHIPPAIQRKLHDLALTYCLTYARQCSTLIRDAREAVVGGNARYIGVHLVPAGDTTTTEG